MKKIWRRVSPLLVVIILAVTAIATVTLTAILFNKAPAAKPDVSAEYVALENKIQNWNTTLDRSAFATTFDRFYSDYKTMNASTFNPTADKLVDKYNTAKASFNNFYLDYYCHYIYDSDEAIDDYLLVRSNYIDAFDDILLQLDNFFNLISPTNDNIIDGLKRTNPAWEDATLQDILDNLFFVQEIADDDLVELQNFFTAHPANQPGIDDTHAYNYALNRYWLAVADSSDYVGELSEYEGFGDYQGVTTSTRACTLAKYRLDHNEDYAEPFAFGKIFNNSNQVSLFDFVFTNLEMAMLPVAFLVMIWAACAFFTDHYQRTMIAPVAAGKKRSTIILTKMSVVLTLTAVSLLLLISLYTVSGLLFFKAYVSPDILFLFNGTKAMSMSAINYFAIYFLDLVFKLLPLIAVCGLFSFTKSQPFVIVGFTTLICIIVIVLNVCLGSFAFYQYVPLMGLDPIRYFGAQLLFAPMPVNYNLWYTFPAMFGITVILYWALIQNFRHHDF